MKTIRYNTFETNSSSTHCVTLCTAKSTFMPIVLENEILEVEPGEYGWEERYYDSFYSKLSYAYTYAANYGSSEDLEALKEALLENTNVKEVVFGKLEDRWYPYGYIDHQSVDEAALIFENEDSLKHFLFNERSHFTTDNDNH